MKKMLLCMALVSASANALPIHLRTNALPTPFGLDTPAPSFSWLSDAKTQDWVQSAYQILVAPEGTALTPGKEMAWNSGKIRASESVDIVYGGSPLKSQQRYVWKVITWDKNGTKEVSRPSWFETGLMTSSDWKAQWIMRVNPDAEKELKAIRWIWLPGQDPLHVPSATQAYFRYELDLKQMPFAASLHVLARGEFTARVNGHSTGHHVEWGAFDREEILPYLRPGKNDIEIDVTSHRTDKPTELSPAAFAASVRVTRPDGQEERLVSDQSWKVRSAVADPWKGATIVGPITSLFGIGSDRQKAIAGPDRIATDVSLMRRDFSVASPVRAARLTITALGAYDAFLNNQPVAPNTMLAPGWTDFHKRVQYQTYDVTTMMKDGANTIGIELGGGWYSSPMTWSGIRYTPGPNLLRAQLDITLANGQHQTIVTDQRWQTAASAITFSEIYGGESYDARLDQHGWSSPSFDATRWSAAVTATPPFSNMLVTAEPDLPINTVLTLHPTHLAPADDIHPSIFDMGQNMVGNVRVHLRGVRGSVVRLRYAERLKPDGNLYTENLRNADATDTYILSGGGDETWAPRFTFHGFRYVELVYMSGSPSYPPTMATIEGLVFNSLPRIPSVRLKSASDVLNKMNELGAWGQRGNFFSVPTDCPQRDERLGWMGDAGAFWRTGSYNFDIDAFSRKFMLDVVDAQSPEGAFSDVSPNIVGQAPGAPGWGDAGIFIPYATWLQYGDTSLLERSWPAMQRWMNFIATTNPDFLRTKALGNNYADWLAPDPHTPPSLIGTAYWALIAREMVEMANALHHPEDAAKYEQQYESIIAAYRAAYVKADGSIEGNTQTAYLSTIAAGIAPPALISNMVDRIAADIEAHGVHLTTGFLGTPFLLSVLDEHGHSDLAFKLLLSESYPSWGYMVKNGATTWWERWNGDTGDPAMNSYNHYAFGSVMAWVYRRAAGIDTDMAGPGFHHLTIHPHFSETLPALHVEYDSAYGTVVSDLQLPQHRFTISLPANTTATVILPDNRVEQIGSGSYSYTLQ